MGVATKNAVGTVMSRMVKRARRNFWRHAQPACVQAIDEPRNWLALEIEFLQLQVQRRPPTAEPYAVDLESVELVAVNGDVAQPLILPRVFLVNLHSDQMRHDVGEPVIVIALHPYDFNLPLGI